MSPNRDEEIADLKLQQARLWAEWRLNRTLDYHGERLTIDGVKKGIRRFNPGPAQKEPCFVCGGHQLITEAHHLVDVSRVANVLHGWAVLDWSPEIPVVVLCPNHHTYWHGIKRRGSKGKKFFSECIDVLSEAEMDNIIRLSELSDEASERVWAEVRRSLPEPPEGARELSERIKQLELEDQ